MEGVGVRKIHQQAEIIYEEHCVSLSRIRVYSKLFWEGCISVRKTHAIDSTACVFLINMCMIEHQACHRPHIAKVDELIKIVK